MTTAEADPTVDLDDLITAWGMLSEAVVAVGMRLAAGLEAADGLSLPEFDVLIRLYREPARMLPLTRLAEDVGLTSGGFTKLADRMEHDGLIGRERSRADRRTVDVFVTDHGWTLTLAALEHHRHDLERAVLAPLGADRLQTLTDLTRTLRDANR